MQRLTRRFAAYLAAIAVTGPACQDAPAAVDRATAGTALMASRELKVGDPAPDFSLPGSDGKVYSLATFQGRQTVVLAWFAKAFSSA